MKLPALLPLLPIPLLLASCFGGDPDGTDALHVGVSIVPHQALAQRLLGDEATVEVAIPPGASPATYQPSDAEMAQLKGCRLFLRTGVPAEQGSWFAAVTGGSTTVIDLRQGIDLRHMGEENAQERGDHRGHDHHGHDHHGHDHHGADPHIWLAPAALVTQVQTMAQAFVAQWPDRAASIEARRDRLVPELNQLDAELRQQLAPYAGHTVPVYHPSWGYYTDAYDLEQLAIEQHGKQPDDAALSHLRDRLSVVAAGILLVQPQIHGRSAERLAATLDLEPVRVDPLGPDPQATLRHLTDVLVRAWSGGP